MFGPDDAFDMEPDPAWPGVEDDPDNDDDEDDEDDPDDWDDWPEDDWGEDE